MNRRARLSRALPAFIAVASVFLIGVLTLAQTGAGLPERVMLFPVQDCSSGASVAWRSSSASARGTAQIVEASPRHDFEARAQTLDAEPADLEVEGVTVRNFSVRFSGLRPDTVYSYRVANDSARSEWFQFRTATAKAKPFRFIYLGDEQTDIRARCSRVMRMALAAAPDARLILHAGDLTNTASSDTEWGDWFGMAGYANASIMNLPAIGNHQYEKFPPTSDTRRLTPHWRAQFALPENGVPGLEESCYYVDYQGVRFVVLNSMEKIAEQAAWLDRILSRNPCRWTIAMYHHPFYSGARNRDNKDVRDAWKPIFDKYRVDLALAGHDHVYGRSNPKEGPAAGHTVHVISVCGVKQYEGGDREWAARFGQDLQLYQIIDVDGGRLRYEARTADGAVYDQFEMRKWGSQTIFHAARNLGPEQVRPPKAATK